MMTIQNHARMPLKNFDWQPLPSALFESITTAGPDSGLNSQLRQSLSAIGSCNDAALAPLYNILSSGQLPTDWNIDVAASFVALRQSGVAPSQILSAMLAPVCETIGLEPAHPLYTPLQVAIGMAGVPSALPFHSHHHTREVVFLTALLALKHHAEIPFADPATTVAEMLVAACIHDFQHDGLGNRRDGRHSPMRLESRALECAEPFLRAASLPHDSWQRIRVMVLATDVSKDGYYAISPAQWIRHAMNDRTKFGGAPDALLQLFSDDLLLMQAALLEDADLGTSAAMPYEFASRMTALVSEETKVLLPTPATLIGFIDHICHGSVITQAADKLFGKNLESLRDRAEQENANTFYSWS